MYLLIDQFTCFIACMHTYIYIYIFMDHQGGMLWVEAGTVGKRPFLLWKVQIAHVNSKTCELSCQKKTIHA